MWDPHDGMVTFSGAHLLDSEPKLPCAPDDSPRDGRAFADDQSSLALTDVALVRTPRIAVERASDDSHTLLADDEGAHVYARYPHPPQYPGCHSAGADSFAFAQHAMDACPTLDSRSFLGLGTPGPAGGGRMPDSPAAASSMALASIANVAAPCSRRTRLPNALGRLSEQIRNRRMALRVDTTVDLQFELEREVELETEMQMQRQREEEEEKEEKDTDTGVEVVELSGRFDGRYAGRMRGRAVPMPCDSDSDVTDEGFCEVLRLARRSGSSRSWEHVNNMSSAFSVTTTSTDQYIEVDLPPWLAANPPTPSLTPGSRRHRRLHPVDSAACSTAASTAWSTLRDADRQICFNVPLATGRRLKKTRAPRTPSPPPPLPASRRPPPTRSQTAPPAAPPASAAPPPTSATMVKRVVRSVGSPVPLSSTSGSSRTMVASPVAPPADPAEVLARRYYNHAPCPQSSGSESDCGQPGSPAGSDSVHGHGPSSFVGCGGAPARTVVRKKSFLHRVVENCRRGDEGEKWVYVEVEHRVTQKVCAVAV
ncbi:uncharacterized protein BXZ73DRAFT_101786 [Epithele typhae]|uniref:uncharacterized protein n=1 Tax=Epithele typhae TaxID=378194 RepID=UPI00200828EE|nr:uncharacterized protein BXZ73DRAFT_101786 [Epithele typhae]KAH9930412.1 hypothetical protein BXZ73DRAFT_101786 [Epithele typhae]